MLHRVFILVFACLTCTACSLPEKSFDSFFPTWLRDPAPKSDPVPPNAKAIVRENLTRIFSTQVSNVRISPPVQDQYGWTVCVRAVAASTGSALVSDVMYLLEIRDGKIGDRTKVDAASPCHRETFEPV